VGKSTLAASLASGPHRARYITLDDAPVLAAARTDPAAFVRGLTEPVVLDEVQRAPDLFLAIKAAVDRGRRPGRFLLTGSANVLLLPRLSDILAGRMEILTLWPLSQGEIEGVREGFIEALFANSLPSMPPEPEPWTRLLERITRGGYPELTGQGAAERREAWFGSYITTMLQREVRDVSNIEGLTMMPRLLALLATRGASLLNFSDLARGVGIPLTTLKRYLALLEIAFLVQTLPAWSANLGKRLVKAPKVLLADSGLMAYLLGMGGERLAINGTLGGSLLENFVAMELRKQVTWSKTRPAMFHFRTTTGHEVDLVLEARGGRVVGIEVKATASPGAADFKPLRLFAEVTGKRFHRGVLLYTGAEPLPFGPNLYALPISALWRLGAEPSAADAASLPTDRHARPQSNARANPRTAARVLTPSLSGGGRGRG
jgi:predicted AAA+ superfamily ATPase